jgi:hypothetical protein
MINAAEIYPLKLLNYPGKCVRINNRTYAGREMEQGIPLPFGANEQHQIVVELQ